MGSPAPEGALQPDRRPCKEAVIKRFVLLSLVASLLLSTTPALALPPGLKVQTYERGIDNLPVDMAWVPGTRTMFFTEKGSGKVRVMHGRELLPAPCVDLAVENDGERGALGITLHPDYPDNHFLYVYFSSARHDDNRVVRFTVTDDLCTNRRLLITGIPAGRHHNAGQLEIMDDHLFISTGDVEDEPRAQDTTDELAGKILRIELDGDVPPDNPDFGAGASPIWTYGHRNPFGLAVKPDTSQLYSSENGKQCDDEINLITEGSNYGWGPGPPVTCEGALGPNPVPPLWTWTPVIAPTDMTWYEGRIDVLDGSLLVGDWITGSIRRLHLNMSGDDITDEDVILNTSGNVLDVHKGPGGWLYFLTTGDNGNKIKRIVEE